MQVSLSAAGISYVSLIAGSAYLFVYSPYNNNNNGATAATAPAGYYAVVTYTWVNVEVGWDYCILRTTSLVRYRRM
jgi:hypothetical protein